MLFNSLEFLVFFPIVVFLFYALPHRVRWILLLAASYYFYMCWKPEYIVLIFVSTCIDYYAAQKMASVEKSRRKPYLFLSLIANLSLLFGFKYFNFFSDSVNALFDSINLLASIPHFEVLLPVGISFYTFQTLSYTIDVYQEKCEPEKHWGRFALYVSFFPQLVAGPIERPNRLLPQFRKAQHFDYQNVVAGLRLVLWGFFKKVVIADRLAVYVDLVYNHPGDYQGTAVLLATIFFAFQIYCDFSGYSDIAIGTAKIMGYDLMQNFNKPYFATSMRNFWQRWHISLSSWFRDYLYIPLGGNRVVKWRWYYNLFITFLISGLWHGANWTFVAWGALHGGYLVAEIILQRKTKKSEKKPPVLKRLSSTIITFALVCLAWVFFRANSLSDALLLLQNLLVIDFTKLGIRIIETWEMVLSILAVALLVGIEILQGRNNLQVFLQKMPRWRRWAFYYALILCIAFFGIYDQKQFIYFQF